MPATEERLARYERRQEQIIQAINGQTEAMETQTATIRRADRLADEAGVQRPSGPAQGADPARGHGQQSSDELGGKMDQLPEAVARAVTTGELPR